MQLTKVRLFFFDLLAALTVFVAYLLTLAPTITWQHQSADSGDLVTAAYTFGVPHPTGYPLYTLLAGIFARLPFGEPASHVALLSALAASGAIFFLLCAVRALTSAETNSLTPLIPVASVLVFAFAPLGWSQADIAEVYALDLLFVAILLWGILTRRPIVSAFALGLGLAHHLSIVFFIPLTVWYFWRGRGKFSIASGFAFVIPLLTYLYLPLRAATNPPINWGNASNIEGFVWLVSGAPYRQYLLSLSYADIFARVAFAARAWLDNFTVLGVALGLWGLSRQFSRDRSLALAFLLTALLITVYSIVYGSLDSFVYLIPAFALFTLWLGLGMSDLVARAKTRPALYAALALMIILPLANLALNWQPMDLSGDTAARDYATRTLAQVPNNAVVFADADDHLFALWYARYVLAGNNSQALIVNLPLLQFDWYWDALRNRAQGDGIANADDYITRAGSIIEASQRAGRAIYFTYDDRTILGKYETRYEDGLYRIVQ